MSKKTVEKAVETTRETPVTTGTGSLALSDWFDHWPDLFARRWPETFRNLPFGEEMFRMEQFVEEDGTFVFRAELPGLDPKEDVTISIDDDRMTIKGERREHTESEENDTYRSEFRYGGFSRMVRLPVGACMEDIKASYHDGILEVRVPVDHERREVKHVEIATE